jgi:hypothetical protein
MARKALAIALGTILAASPASLAAQFANPPLQISAEAAADSKIYCMRLEPLTGTLVERVECWTRLEWADQGVDVDREWATNGVRTIG